MEKMDIDIKNLYELSDKPVPENLPVPEELKAMVEHQFSFLPQPIQVEFDRWKGAITFPEEAQELKAEAEYLPRKPS